MGYFFSSIILSFPNLLLPLIVISTIMHPKQVLLSCQLETPSYIQSGFFWHMKGNDVYSVPHFGDLGLICFLITGLATTHLCYLGPDTDFLITGLSYIRFSYNRKTLSNNKEQFCRDPARPFLLSGFSSIRLSYKRSVLYM
jgi:hypothetical protein